MSDREWHIGICGTFDVANYGDLLFPLLAEAELRQRLGLVNLKRYSYHSKVLGEWPYPVHSVTELPAAAGQLDGLLIGGGDLIRFDKAVAPGYGPTTPSIHHPTGYWLTPMLIALQQGCPVAWNAPGVHGEMPAWAEPLLQTAIRLSSYVAVRDAASRQLLSRFASEAEIRVVPDTALGAARLVNVQRPSEEYHRLRESVGLQRPYIVVQATPGLGAFARLVRNHPQLFRDYQLVILPFGPVLGDHVGLFDDDLPNSLRLTTWPGPLLITELIGQAVAVVGVSLHLALAALALGVPVFRPADARDGKYAILQGFDKIVPFDRETGIDPQAFAAKLGRAEPSPATREALGRVSAHWDAVAAAFAAGRSSATREAFGRFWQSAPGWLEARAARGAAALAARDATLVQREADRDVTLAARDAAQAERDAALAARNALQTDRDAALAARDAMLAERDTALAERDTALAERDAALAARDATLVQREVERDAALAARDAWTVRYTTALAERDNLLQSTSWRLTGPIRALSDQVKSRRTRRPHLIDFTRITQQSLATDPYEYTFVNNLFASRAAQALATSYPRDHFRLVKGHDGEKGYEYHARSLIGMGADLPAFADGLSAAWQQLAEELLSGAYRAAMTKLTGLDLRQVPIEVNVFHYPAGSWLGPHLDLKDKIVTHVFYFNQTWNKADGGCLTVLRSADMSDVVTDVAPIVGNSSVLVRSDHSWHAVSRVVEGCRRSRRSMTVTFYHPGSKSTMWPEGEAIPLHAYDQADDD